MLPSWPQPSVATGAKYVFETCDRPKVLSLAYEKLESGLVVSVNHSELKHLNDHSTKFLRLESKNKAGAETKVVLSALVEIGGDVVELSQPP